MALFKQSCLNGQAPLQKGKGYRQSQCQNDNRDQQTARVDVLHIASLSLQFLLIRTDDTEGHVQLCHLVVF